MIYNHTVQESSNRSAHRSLGWTPTFLPVLLKRVGGGARFGFKKKNLILYDVFILFLWSYRFPPSPQPLFLSLKIIYYKLKRKCRRYRRRDKTTAWLDGRLKGCPGWVQRLNRSIYRYGLYKTSVEAGRATSVLIETRTWNVAQARVQNGVLARFILYFFTLPFSDAFSQMRLNFLKRISKTER